MRHERFAVLLLSHAVFGFLQLRCQCKNPILDMHYLYIYDICCAVYYTNSENINFKLPDRIDLSFCIMLMTSLIVFFLAAVRLLAKTNSSTVGIPTCFSCIGLQSLRSGLWRFQKHNICSQEYNGCRLIGHYTSNNHVDLTSSATNSLPSWSERQKRCYNLSQYLGNCLFLS